MRLSFQDCHRSREHRDGVFRHCCWQSTSLRKTQDLLEGSGTSPALRRHAAKDRAGVAVRVLQSLSASCRQATSTARRFAVQQPYAHGVCSNREPDVHKFEMPAFVRAYIDVQHNLARSQDHYNLQLPPQIPDPRDHLQTA